MEVGSRKVVGGKRLEARGNRESGVGKKLYVQAVNSRSQILTLGTSRRQKAWVRR